MTPFQNIGAYVLAGGKSSRMGQEKGLMPLLNQPLVLYVLQALKPCFEHITIVSDNPAYGAFGYPVIPDALKNRGPAAGIYTALTHSPCQLNFCVSCDMPFITPQLVGKLVSEAIHSGADITLPVWEKGMEPLFAVYSQVVLPHFSALIASGKVKLQYLVSCFNYKAMPIQAAYEFTNLNTPQEFETALQHIQQMSITLLAFGQTAEATGAPELIFTAPVHTTTELKALLEQRFPQLAGLQYAVALNGKLVTQNTPITLPATVALLPPFSGG